MVQKDLHRWHQLSSHPLIRCVHLYATIVPDFPFFKHFFNYGSDLSTNNAQVLALALSHARHMALFY